jgi:hypothetical protein
MTSALNNIYRDRLLPGEFLVDPFKQCQITPIPEGYMAMALYGIKLVATGALVIPGMVVKAACASQITQHNERVKAEVIERRSFTGLPETLAPGDTTVRLTREQVLTRIEDATRECFRFVANIDYFTDTWIMVRQAQPNPRWAPNDPTRPFFG